MLHKTEVDSILDQEISWMILIYKFHLNHHTLQSLLGFSIKCQGGECFGGFQAAH